MAGRIATRENPWHYIGCGLDHILLVGIEIDTDSETGREEALIPRIQDLHDCIFLGLVQKPGALTGQEVRYMRRHLGWTQVVAAEKVRIKTMQHFSDCERRGDGEAFTIQTEMLWRLVCAEAFKSTGRRPRDLARAAVILHERIEPLLNAIETRKGPMPVEIEHTRHDWRLMAA